ncbi:hypothetical protein ABTX24_21360 [Nocardioides sp. NPDC127514]
MDGLASGDMKRLAVDEGIAGESAWVGGYSTDADVSNGVRGDLAIVLVPEDERVWKVSP